jgi:3-hydroxyacyl-CoA dehydrogenase/enoyl-CoA hydratase/3-hydroxybutyryl-CoA epimerase
MNGIDKASTDLWSLEVDAGRIAWLCFDIPGASANALSRRAMEELDERLAELEKLAPEGLVIVSGKSGFIAGADVKEFSQVHSAEEAVPFIRAAHGVLARLARLPCPSVAAINGYCLGGGLELALACDYRICVDDPKVTLGLPEVMLGIHPGFGGTVRAVQLLGVTTAMDMMLTGKNLRPARALQSGLIDRIVPEAELRSQAVDILRKQPALGRASLAQRLLSLAPLRGPVARKIESQVSKRARRDHYPAPYAIIELWRRYGANPSTAYEAEAQSVAHLVCTPTSRNLVRVFFLQERLKGLSSAAEASSTRVHVIGAGVMGGDIAAWCALRGFNVSLEDQNEAMVSAAVERAGRFFKKRERVPGAALAASKRLQADPSGRRLEEADVVIEAIFEDAAAKQALYRRIEPRLKPGSILATNTSSIPLEELESDLADPGRLVGLHFFNPVAQMPLLEVVESKRTDPAVRAGAIAFVRGIDKLPLPCRSHPGFLVNRVLMPYLTEAMLAAEDGLPFPLIDEVATRFGMPMGPIELADTVGLDVCLHVGRILARHYDRPAPEALAMQVADKKLGRKTGSGLYQWTDGKAQKPPLAASERAPDDLEDRLILAMVNEAVAILREGVAGDEDMIDAGTIFGTGFAPFRGGPLRYARERGAAAVHERLQQLESRYGSRFRPDLGWEQFLHKPL